MANEYLGQSRMPMPGGDAERDLEFYEIASLLWFYDLANKQCLPLPRFPARR